MSQYLGLFQSLLLKTEENIILTCPSSLVHHVSDCLCLHAAEVLFLEMVLLHLYLHILVKLNWVFQNRMYPYSHLVQRTVIKMK